MAAFKTVHFVLILIEALLILSKKTGAQTDTGNLNSREGSEAVSEDPSSWPGHKEFLGSANNVDVDTVSHNTSSQIFLNEYVLTQKPLRLRGSCSTYPAMREWERDEQLIGRPDSFTTIVPVLGQTSNPGDIPFRRFLLNYVKKTWYIYSETPPNLRSEVYLPTFLMCNPILQQLSKNLLWYSGRDRFLPIRRSDEDTVKCVISGNIEIILIDPFKYSKQVPDNLDAVDVTQVDFRKHPGLGKIVYERAVLSPGDCLYIPAKWFQQMSAYGRTIGVDVTFLRTIQKDSDGACGDHQENQTLWEHTFSQNSIDKHKELNSALHHFIEYLSDQKDLTFDQFVEAVQKDALLLTNMTEWTGEYKTITQELFQVLDQTHDGRYSYKDVEDLTTEKIERLRGVLLDRLIDYGEIMVDQQEDLIQKQRQSQGGLDTLTQDFIGQYVEELETVLVQSIDQFVTTGTMPDIQAKMAAMDAKKLIGKDPVKPSQPEQVKEEQAEYYTSREDAKAKLKEKREKQQAANQKAESAAAENEDAFVVVEGLDEEEEILADEEDDVIQLPQKDQLISADSRETVSTTKLTSRGDNRKISFSKNNDKKSAKKDEL